MTWDQGIVRETTALAGSNGSNARTMTYLEAIREGLRYEMQRDPSVLTVTSNK